MFLIFLLLFVSIASAQTYNDDYALLTEINRARIQNNVHGSLVTSSDLHQTARVLAQNHLYFECNETHNSCQGETFARRIKRFYPGFFGASEVWGWGFGPNDIVDSWLDSPTHRAAILGEFREFGGASVVRSNNFGYFNEGIVDLGSRIIYPAGTPVISGAVYGGYAWMTYDASKPPKAAFVSIGSKDYSLNLYEGVPARGVYRVAVETPAGCDEARFNVLSDFDFPIIYPNPEWGAFIGTLCSDAPLLVDRVRIKIRSTGNRLNKNRIDFRIETLPGVDPSMLSIRWGDSGFNLPAKIVRKETKTRTIFKGTIVEPTLPAAANERVRIYFDYKLVGSLWPKSFKNHTLIVSR